VRSKVVQGPVEGSSIETDHVSALSLHFAR
jgi:hypothetical protein